MPDNEIVTNANDANKAPTSPLNQKAVKVAKKHAKPKAKRKPKAVARYAKGWNKAKPKSARSVSKAANGCTTALFVHMDRKTRKALERLAKAGSGKLGTTVCELIDKAAARSKARAA